MKVLPGDMDYLTFYSLVTMSRFTNFYVSILVENWCGGIVGIYINCAHFYTTPAFYFRGKFDRTVEVLKFFRSKLFLALLVTIVAIRVIAPFILLNRINAYLGDASPVYIGHLDDFRMSIWRGAYGLERLRLTLRDKPVTFFRARDIDVSVAWRELFKGRIKMDIVIDGAELIYSQYVVKKLAEKPKENYESAKGVKNTLIPISVDKTEIVRSGVISSDFFGITDKLPTSLENVEATITNLTPDETEQISHFKMSANFPQQAPLEASGLFNMMQTPSDWTAKIKLSNFDITTTNNWMYQVIPLSFESGVLTIFSETESKSGTIKGYVKPFLKNVHIMGDERDFKGLQQWGIELSTAMINGIFRTRDDKTVATKMDFSYANGKFNYNLWDVIKELFKNGYVEELSQDFEYAKEKK